MGIIDGKTGMETLTAPDCWKLLSLSTVGRVGIVVGGAPEIYPVNFVVDHASVIFRTAPGTKLAGLTRNPSVCFEADGLVVEDHAGWSVLVKGNAVELRDPDELRRAAELPLRPWAVVEAEHWVRIVADEVTGRRIWNP